MMMALGTFVFSLPTLAYQKLQHATAWRHSSSERVGARAANQYLGPGEETIELDGTVAAELLLDRVGNARADNRQMILDPELRVRASTAPYQ